MLRSGGRGPSPTTTLYVTSADTTSAPSPNVTPAWGESIPKVVILVYISIHDIGLVVCLDLFIEEHLDYIYFLVLQRKPDPMRGWLFVRRVRQGKQPEPDNHRHWLSIWIHTLPVGGKGGWPMASAQSFSDSNSNPKIWWINARSAV